MPLAGPGTGAPIRVEARLIAEHGGNPGEWVKVTSSSATLENGVPIQAHAYVNVRTGQVVELKTKFPEGGI